MMAPTRLPRLLTMRGRAIAGNGADGPRRDYVPPWLTGLPLSFKFERWGR